MMRVLQNTSGKEALWHSMVATDGLGAISIARQ